MEGRRAGLDLRDPKARDRAEAHGGLAGLGDARVAGHREEDEGVLDGEAVLVDEHFRCLLGDELQRVVVGIGRRVGEPAVGELGDGPGRLFSLQQVEADVDFACDLDALDDDLGVDGFYERLPERLPDLFDLAVEAQQRIRRFAIEERLEHGLPPVELIDLYRGFEMSGDYRAQQYLDRVYVEDESISPQDAAAQFPVA